MPKPSLLQADIARVVSKLEETERALQLKAEEADLHRIAVNKERQRVERAAGEVENLKQQVTAATDRISGLEAALKLARQEAEDAQSRAAEAAQIADKATAENASSSETAQQELSQLRSETERLQGKVRQQITALDKAEEETSVLRRRLAEKHELEEDVALRLTRQEEATAALLQKVAAAQEQLAMPCETCKSYEMQLRKLHISQESLKADANEAGQNFEAATKELEEQREALKAALEELEVARAKAKAKTEELEHTKSTLEEQCVAQAAELEKIRSQVHFPLNSSCERARLVRVLVCELARLAHCLASDPAPVYPSARVKHTKRRKVRCWRTSRPPRRRLWPRTKNRCAKRIVKVPFTNIAMPFCSSLFLPFW